MEEGNDILYLEEGNGILYLEEGNGILYLEDGNGTLYVDLHVKMFDPIFKLNALTKTKQVKRPSLHNVISQWPPLLTSKTVLNFQSYYILTALFDLIVAYMVSLPR